MVDPARFWDRIANRYARSPVADEASYQRKLEVTRTYFRPEMEVLEFGCGTGSTAIAHAPYVKHILAIDCSARMLEICRSKAERAQVGNVTFQQATIETFAAAPESLDAVLGLSILHLVEDREAVFAKVFALLKPGGIFVSSTACLADTQQYLRLILLPGSAVGLLPRVRFFTKRALESSLTAAGFRLAHSWQPGARKAVFIVAVKPGRD